MLSCLCYKLNFAFLNASYNWVAKASRLEILHLRVDSLIHIQLCYKIARHFNNESITVVHGSYVAALREMRMSILNLYVYGYFRIFNGSKKIFDKSSKAQIISI